MRRAATRGMRDLRRWPRGSAAGAETGPARHLWRGRRPGGAAALDPARACRHPGMAGCGDDRPGGPLRPDRRGLRRAAGRRSTGRRRSRSSTRSSRRRRRRAAAARRRLRHGRAGGRGGPSLAARSTSTASTRPPACSRSPSASARRAAAADRGRIALPPGARRPAAATRTARSTSRLTSFVLQLVPSRHRALREIRRVLAPGRADRAGHVAAGRRAARRRTTCTTRRCSTPASSRGSRGGGSDDLPRPEAAVAALRRAGFAGASARAEASTTSSRPESFLAFLARFDDADQFDVDRARRARRAARRTCSRGCGRCPPDGLRLVGCRSSTRAGRRT